MTDAAEVYEKIGRAFSGHGTVNHTADECKARRFHAHERGGVVLRAVHALYSDNSTTSARRISLLRWTACGHRLQMI
jgi:hypothetical protein